MKKATILAVVFLLMSLASFAQIMQPAASPNSGAPDFNQGGHTAPMIASAGQTGACQVSAYEAIYPPMLSSTQLILKMGPCGWSTNQNGQFTTHAPIHLQSMHCWIGTSSNTRFEVVSNIQIWFKDASNIWHMMFNELCEYDKHQDIVGNTDKFWTYPLGFDIPAGSIINVYRYPGGFLHCGKDWWKVEGPTVAFNAATGAGTQDNPDGNNPAASTVDNCATEAHWILTGTGK